MKAGVGPLVPYPSTSHADERFMHISVRVISGLGYSRKLLGVMTITPHQGY